MAVLLLAQLDWLTTPCLDPHPPSCFWPRCWGEPPFLLPPNPTPEAEAAELPPALPPPPPTDAAPTFGLAPLGAGEGTFAAAATLPPPPATSPFQGSSPSSGVPATGSPTPLTQQPYDDSSDGVPAWYYSQSPRTQPHDDSSDGAWIEDDTAAQYSHEAYVSPIAPSLD